MKLQALKKGDVVDIVAPASRCTDDELHAAINALRELGLEPRLPEDIFADSELFSNSDEMRLKFLKKAIYSKDSKIIWCVRGGYGALRLMPEISKWKKPNKAKIFLGYSDITTLHSFFNQKWNWPTFHGPLLDRLGRGDMPDKEKNQLTDILFGKIKKVEFKNLEPMNAYAQKSKMLAGKVMGGNLTVLQSSLGTANAFNPKGAVLFFEDRGERPHRVDRMLSQAKQAGWFKKAKAVVLGDFIVSDEKDEKVLWQDVFKRFADEVSIPVVKGLPAGHSAKLQMTIPLNTKAELRTGNKILLNILTGIS